MRTELLVNILHLQNQQLIAAALNLYSKGDIRQLSELDDKGFALALTCHILLLNKSSADHKDRLETEFRDYLQFTDRLNLPSPASTLNALETAVHLGNISIVTQLLEANVTPTEAACCMAVKYNRDDILAVLLEKVNVTDAVFLAVLEIAAKLTETNDNAALTFITTSPKVAAVILDKLSKQQIHNQIQAAIYNNEVGKMQMLIDYCIAKEDYALLHDCLLITMLDENNDKHTYFAKMQLTSRVNDAIKMTKESYVNKIASEPDEAKKIALRDQALNRESHIGQIMFQHRGLLDCKLSSGSLGKMMKLFPPSQPSPSSETSGVELGMRSHSANGSQSS